MFQFGGNEPIAAENGDGIFIYRGPEPILLPFVGEVAPRDTRCVLNRQ